MKCNNGSESIQSTGGFGQLVKNVNCPCSDGKTRTVTITGQPDTFFSVPGNVKVKGKTVTGFVTTAPDYREGVREGFIFQSNQFGKNGNMLPHDYTDEIIRSFGA